MRLTEHAEALPQPIQTLSDLCAAAGKSIVRVAFENSFFVPPDLVRARPVQFPTFARKSNAHYPELTKGDKASWKGREVTLDDNHKAQDAWKAYTGRLERGTGYGVRHIWGNPWDPDAYTAGWNLCYMPFWVGMLTEEQHPLPELERAIKQASYDLFFRTDPVCTPPAFVRDPGISLASLLGDQHVLLLRPNARGSHAPRAPGGATEPATQCWVGRAQIEEGIRRFRRNPTFFASKTLHLQTSSNGMRFEIEKPTLARLEVILKAVDGDRLHLVAEEVTGKAGGKQFKSPFKSAYLNKARWPAEESENFVSLPSDSSST